MSFYKNGIATSFEMDESMGVILSDKSLSYKFTPAKDTSNSTFNSWWINFSDYASGGEDHTFRIILDVTYTGFDSSSTAGTFGMHWQGDNYKIETSSNIWEGTNYMTSALNAQQNLTALVNSTTGSYRYNTTFTIPASWFDIYSRSRLGIRSNYSNGVGNITISNVQVSPIEYSAEARIMSIYEDHIVAQELYEI